MLTGALLLIAGIFGLIPFDARIAWACVLLAGLFLLIPVHI